MAEGLAIHLVAATAAAARAVAIIRDRIAGGARPEDIVVLARVNSALLPVQVSLSDAGIGHSAPLGASVLGRTGLRTALAYVRLGLDPQRMRRDDLLDTLNRPARKVKSAVAPHLRRSTRWSLGQLEQIVMSLDHTQQDRFGGYLADLRQLGAAIGEGADTARCLWLVRNRIGLGEAMDALDSSRTRPEGSSHGDDLDALEQLAADHPDPATFRDRLVERLRVPGDPHGVMLSTVHRVKGLEWDHVLVVAANDGLFPHRLSDDVEEELRVLHVALTRCRRQVDVIADRSRPSPFLAQLTTDAPPRRAAPPVPAQPGGAATAVPVAAADGAVIAQPGLEVTVAGGLTGRVAQLRDGAAVVLVDAPIGVGRPVHLRVPWGQPVTVGGKRAVLAPPGRTVAVRVRNGPPPGTTAPADPGLLQTLKAWRLRTATAANLPAFVVFHDRTLEAIAASRPRTVRELGAIPGIGPAKLERYADDLLALLDTH